MRITFFITLLLLCLGCANTNKARVKSNILNGSWVPVQEEIGGKALPGAAFDKQKLIISDSTYTFSAESVDKGIVKYTENKMDIFGREGVNAGKHFTAFYKLENEQLIICYNLLGDSYPAAFETKAKAMYFLCTFKKE